MSKKMFLPLILVFTLLMSSFTVCNAAGTNVKVNLLIGKGDTVELLNYLKDAESINEWKSSNIGVVAVDSSVATAKDIGSAVIKATGEKYNYAITIKVIENCAAVAESVTKTANKTTDNIKSKYNISAKENYLTLGVNSNVRVSYAVTNGYTKYSWNSNNKKIAAISNGGRIKGVGEGITRITATATGEQNGNVFRFVVKVDPNCIAKNVTFSRNSVTELNKYLPEDISNYVIKVGDGSGISENEKKITTGGANSWGFVTATSLTGGKNYTFVINVL